MKACGGSEGRVRIGVRNESARRGGSSTRPRCLAGGALARMARGSCAVAVAAWVAVMGACKPAAPLGPWVPQGPVAELALVDSGGVPCNTQYPHLRDDQLEIYFSADCPTSASGTRLFNIYVSTRPSKTSPWGTPTMVDVFYDATADSTHPVLTHDAKTLYLNRKGNIYRSTRSSTTSPWSVPLSDSALSSLYPLASIDTFATDFHVLPDGTQIMNLSSDGLVDFGSPSAYLVRWDIWLATRPNDQSTWTISHPTAINAEPAFRRESTLSADGLTIYFGQDPMTLIGSIYTATRSSTTSEFGTPTVVTELGMATSSDGVQQPHLTQDGRTLYYVQVTKVYLGFEFRIQHATR